MLPVHKTFKTIHVYKQGRLRRGGGEGRQMLPLSWGEFLGSAGGG